MLKLRNNLIASCNDSRGLPYQDGELENWEILSASMVMRIDIYTLEQFARQALCCPDRSKQNRAQVGDNALSCYKTTRQRLRLGQCIANSYIVL